LLTTYRLNGWAYEGTQARKACNFVRGTRWNACSVSTTAVLV
jgi:hypothetical protein